MQNTIGRIDKWFPKSVYIADNILLDQLDYYEKNIKSIIDTYGCNSTGMQQVKSTHTTDDTLYQNPVFASLIDKIVFHSYTYLSQLGYSREQIEQYKIINMWANISHENDYLFPHHHSGSIISGAFYIKTYPNSVIKFFNNIINIIFKF